jgi:hypothetical protein
MHNSSSTKKFLTKSKFIFDLRPEDDDEDGDVISAWHCLCLCSDDSSGAGEGKKKAINPYPDSLEPFNLNDFPCMARYEFSSRTTLNIHLLHQPILSAAHTSSLDYTG